MPVTQIVSSEGVTDITTKLNNAQFRAFMTIIHAARNGRYMHGNGAQWYIVDTYGNNVCIDTTTEHAFAVPVPTYTGVPSNCYSTASSLERFLMACDGYVHTSEMQYHAAFNTVKKHIQDGNLVYKNGNHWYVRVNDNIICFELGIVRNVTVIHSYDALSSWRYIQSTTGNNCHVTDSTKKYFGIAA
jgi:hypothetical protein